MKKIVIWQRTHTHEQAHRLLKNIGWLDDVTAFLASLNDTEQYRNLDCFKRHFRDWRKEQKRLANEAETQEMIRTNPKVASAYHLMMYHLSQHKLKTG